MKCMILIIGMCSGLCFAGDFMLTAQPAMIPQQQIIHLIAIINVAAVESGNPINSMKWRYGKNARHNTRNAQRNQKFPKRKNIHQRANR